MAETKKASVSMALQNPNMRQLTSDLQLTKEQIQKANAAALQLQSNYALKDCDGFSLLRYCYETARYNFVRDDAVYPVPYKVKDADGNYITQVQAQIGYKGFREIVMRSNKYDEVNASKVYSCDRVFRDRETGSIKVSFNEDYTAINKAQVIGYLAYAKSKDGRLTNTLFMTKEQLVTHGKTYSKTYSSTWGKDDITFEKMAMKTVIKQLCQQLDQTPDLVNAIKADQIVFGSNGESDQYLDNPNVKIVTDENKNTTIDAEVEEVKNSAGLKDLELGDDAFNFND